LSKLATLEAEAEARRSRFENTLRRLEEKATPKNLIRSVSAKVGAPTASEVTEALRQNPILAAVLALCVGAIAIEVVRVRNQRTILNGNRGSAAPDRTRLPSMS